MAVLLLLGALAGRAEAQGQPPAFAVSPRILNIELLDSCIRALTPEVGADEKRLLGLLTTALAYVSAGKADEFLDDANRALAAEPKSSIVLIYRAFAQHTKKHWHAAIKDLDDAIAANNATKSVMAIAYYLHGDFNWGMNDGGIALKDSDSAIALNPKLAPAYSMKGSLLAENMKIREAADALDKAISVDPGEPSGYVARGNFRSEHGSATDAIRDITRAIELNPRNPLPYSLRSRLYFYKGDHDSADRDSDQAAKILAEIEGQ